MRTLGRLALVATFSAPAVALAQPGAIVLRPIGQFALPGTTLEIAAYDAASERVFVINAEDYGTAGQPLVGIADEAPESSVFVAKADSPINAALLIVPTREAVR